MDNTLVDCLNGSLFFFLRYEGEMAVQVEKRYAEMDSGCGGWVAGGGGTFTWEAL